MKVYIITDGGYSAYQIKAVFTDKKQAELYSAFHGGTLEEWETDKSYFDIDTKLFIVHKIHKHREAFEVADTYTSPRSFSRFDEDCFGDVTIYVCLEERDDKKALKIAQDMYAEHTYERNDTE